MSVADKPRPEQTYASLLNRMYYMQRRCTALGTAWAYVLSSRQQKMTRQGRGAEGFAKAKGGKEVKPCSSSTNPWGKAEELLQC